LLDKLKLIDEQGKENEWTEEPIEERKKIELELEEIYEAEELYWQQRGGERWILEGDSNTKFFHLAANGRRRKKSILLLEEDGENNTDPKHIQRLIYNYYKCLFGNQHQTKVTLFEAAWGEYGRLSPRIMQS